MVDIEKGELVTIDQLYEARERRIDELCKKMSRNPLKQLVRRVDYLGVSTFDVEWKEIRQHFQIAQIPGDRVIFLFEREPKKTPPNAS